jgi:hypothetical protein
MKKTFLFIVLACNTIGYSQTKTDSTLITEAALNYIEGWYNGDTLRMDKALHTDLVKSAPVFVAQTKGTVISSLSKSYMMETTKMGIGKKTPRENIKNEVKILDINDIIACAKVKSTDFTDYLQLVKSNGQWRILHVLWEPVPKDAVKK